MNESNEDIRWPVEFLKSMSLKTDPYAENLIHDIVLGNDFKSLRTLFTTLSNDHQTISDSALPKSVINYFNEEINLPTWADETKIALAQQVYERYGPQVALILNFKALPLCYSCKNGAQVLGSTGRLTEANKDTSRAMRRLFETSQMVINVMSPGGLSPTGKGIITVKKVRLYHAAIRYYLCDETYAKVKWDVNYYGQPINQEEMAGTLMAFSALVLNGLEELGAKLSSKEKDAYIHCWNIVGHFIGLHEELYPKNYREAWGLGIAIIKRNCEKSADNAQLTKSLLDFSDNFFKGSMLTSFLFKGIPTYLITFSLQNISMQTSIDILDTLQVDKKQGFFTQLKGRLFIFMLRAVTLAEKDSLVKKLYGKITGRFLQGMIDQYLKTYQVEFYIPPSLKASWKMK
jgi:hypothetical protein